MFVDFTVVDFTVVDFTVVESTFVGFPVAVADGLWIKVHQTECASLRSPRDNNLFQKDIKLEIRG